MYKGTMIEGLIEIVMKAEDHAHVAAPVEPLPEPAYEGYLYELPQSSAVLIGVA